MSKEKCTSTTIANNVFSNETNVNFDANSIEVLQKVSEALLNITKIFMNQSVNVTLLKIETNELPDTERKANDPENG